ncbi:TIGR00730 family Rossman fold protein [Streptomyces sp. NPDC001978]|uniref:LOG family protein n=1 Tax=Streptomyces sp. NPDC001978 TaxID=3364627 RepID=UPI0036CC47BD
MRVTVYAGSSPGVSSVYAEEAAAFARELAEGGHEIVYGGGSRGLMGVLADAALVAGGRVTGVIPRSLYEAEVAHLGLSELHVVDTMHERKDLMARLGDCFVALPGGLGTVEELFEVWAWLILGHHGKPVTVLNTDGYWDGLLDLVGGIACAGFMRPDESASLVPLAKAADLFALCAAWQPPPPRWA